MKAEEIEVGKLFNGGQQLLIPLWQRHYSWEHTQWAELWTDLERLQEEGVTGHFVGSIVLQALPWSGLPSEARRFLVVDGQQRITTLTLLVCAIRDRLVEFGLTDEERAQTRADYTAQLLLNTTHQEGHRHRLVLQENDRVLLDPIVDGKGTGTGSSLVERAYDFFRRRISGLDRDAITQLLSRVLVRLSAVWVTLEDGDNAHRVFQTLNAGGKKLKQADLVRNYFFLLLGELGNDFYESHWRQLETDLNDRELEDYLVAWSITQGHTGGKDSLFRYFHKDLVDREHSPEAVLEYGRGLVEVARYFRWIREPSGSSLDLTAQSSLRDLRNWTTQPAEGLLLWLLRRHGDGKLDSKYLHAGFEVVLSFMVRRQLAGYEPNLHKSIFVATTRKLRSRSDLSQADTVDYLKYVLSSGIEVRTWPTDEAISAVARETPVYSSARAGWAFLILERVNRELFENAKHAPPELERSKYSVEHVLPQTMTPRWTADLQDWGVENPTHLHQSRLHVLGNLTLTPINSELGNLPFEEKRVQLDDDWLRLNSDVANSNTWTEHRINERSTALAKKACNAFAAPMSTAELQAARIAFGDAPTQADDAVDEEIASEDA